MAFDHARSFDDVPGLTDPDAIGTRGDELTPERRLWQACIARAWLDAFKPPRVAGSEFNVTDEERWQARRWLTVSVDPWRGDRRDVCDLAGISESLLRRAAVARLAVAKAEEAEVERAEHRRAYHRAYSRQWMRRKRARQRVDEAFEQLLTRESTMAPVEIDAALTELASLERLAA